VRSDLQLLNTLQVILVFKGSSRDVYAFPSKMDGLPAVRKRANVLCLWG
jgi:hypothetical protein